MEFSTRSSFCVHVFHSVSKFFVSLAPYISLAFLLFASYLLQLSSSLYLSRLSSPPLSLSPYLSHVSHQFSTLFLLYFSRFSLTLLFRTAFYFSFSLYFPRLSVSISSLIAVRGQRYLKPFTAPAAVSLGDSRLYTGLMGASPLDSGFACVRNETSFKRRDPCSRC